MQLRQNPAQQLRSSRYWKRISGGGSLEQRNQRGSVNDVEFNGLHREVTKRRLYVARIGDFINALVSFLLIGAAVYFLIVLPVNRLLARMRRGEAAPAPTTKKCPECLSDVPIAARRCAFCTSVFTEAQAR